MANLVPESGSFYENVKDFLGAPAGAPAASAAPAVAPAPSGFASYRLGSGIAPPMFGGFPLGSGVAPPMIGNVGYGLGFAGSPGMGISTPVISRPAAYGAPLATAQPVTYGAPTQPYLPPYRAAPSIGPAAAPLSPGPVARSVRSFQPPILSSAPITFRGVSSYAPSAYGSFAPPRYGGSYGMSYGGPLMSVRY